MEEASSDADWVLLLLANLGLGLELEKGTFPMNPAPPPLCCGQLGSLRLARTAEAMEVRNHVRPVRFRRNSGMNFQMRVEQSMSQQYTGNHAPTRPSRATGENTNFEIERENPKKSKRVTF